MSRLIRLGSIAAASLVCFGAAVVPAHAATVPEAANADATASSPSVVGFDWAGIKCNSGTLKCAPATTPAQMAQFKADGGTTLAVAIDRFVSNQYEPSFSNAISSYITAAHQNGLTVQALWGDPDYALPPSEAPSSSSNQTWNSKIAADVVSYNASAPQGAQFSGMNMDVEPWNLPFDSANDPSWNANPTHLAEDWLETVQQTTAISEPAGLPLTVEDQYNLDGTKPPSIVSVPSSANPSGSPLSGTPTQVLMRELQDPSGPTNAINDMAYRSYADGPSGSIAEASSTFGYENPAAPVDVLVGQDTADDGGNITFSGCGLPTLQSSVAAINAHYAAQHQTAYAGVAVNEILSMEALSSTAPSPLPATCQAPAAQH